MTIGDALISDCGRYRYWLTRQWDARLGPLTFIGLNPSTADATQDDPTIRKCIGFATRLGFGAIWMLNLYAYRATDWRNLRDAVRRGDDVFGPLYHAEFNKVLNLTRDEGGAVVAAWGAHVEHIRNAQSVAASTLDVVFAHQLHPKRFSGGRHATRHPLMLPYATPLELCEREATKDAK